MRCLTLNSTSTPSVSSRVQAVHQPRAPQRTEPRPLPTAENPSNWEQEVCAKCKRQACTLIPGAPVFQDHASVSCHLFNEALWYGQWFGKLAKYKMKINRRTEWHHCRDILLRNRTSTLQGAHSQLGLHRNNSGHRGTVTNEPASKQPTQGGQILTQANAILISLPGF